MHDDNSASFGALYEILGETADPTGKYYFDRLVKGVATALDVRVAFISLFTDDGERMRLLSFWDRGAGEIRRDVVYDVGPTPCRLVMKGQVFHCPHGVRDRFPDDPHLAALNAESYRGVPMIGPTGRHLGHVAAVDTEPIDDEPTFIRLMKLFAARSTVELERMTAEQACLRSEARLDAILQTAMDAIVNVDHERRIRLFNAAAERLFRCPGDQAIGSSVDRFLSPESRKVLQAAFDDPAMAPQTVVGQCARRADGTEFPIEASLSHLTIEGRRHCTLIVRNIADLVTARQQIERLEQDRSYLAEEARRDRAKIVGESECLAEILHQVELVAVSDATVLILGETGTGKELVARSIHAGSARRERPLVRVNCGALPAELIESELFGHEKGSFTGAVKQRIGRFELADGGTIFLDEIGDLPLTLQTRLLHVLQHGEFERVGGTKTLSVDVRVLAATNRDLPAMVREREFREDLFYRLNVFPVVLPPLRDRREDIPLLVELFVSRRRGRQTASEPILDETLALLEGYDWPGNVRELENVVERALILSRGGTIERKHLLIPVVAESAGGAFATLREVEIRHIENALRRTGWKVSGPAGAAELLGVNASTLDSRIRKLGIGRPFPSPTASVR